MPAAMNRKELEGKRIVFTRHLREDDTMGALLREHGAELIPLPLIEVASKVDPEHEEDVLSTIQTYEWIVFSSPNGVRSFFEAFFRRFKDIRCFGPAKIACVGKQTAHEVNRLHLEVDLIPPTSTGLAMAKAMIETGTLPSACVLWVSGDKINRAAVSELAAKGEAIVDTFVVYESTQTDLTKNAQARRFREGGADLVFFASPSAVQSFVDQSADLQPGPNASIPKTLSIGPTTSEAMVRLNVRRDGEADSPEPESILKAAIRLLS